MANRPITIVPLEISPPTAQIRGSRKVPGGGADLYVRMTDVIDALRATGHNSALHYLDEAWQNVSF